MEHGARTQDEKLEMKTTTCYMCACRCGIRVHLRDGEVRYIDGNPESSAQQGRDLRQGRVGDHEAVLAGAPHAAADAQARRRARRRRSSSRSRGRRAFAILEERLAHIRATDPKKFALFTGRDQMQALTGLFARQFGTPNYAAHGGFCSVNMAAGMIYTIGGSFWEFGGPDLDRAKLFVMIGTAEDHHSNPLKIAISKFKRAGGRFISINPIRTGYSAIADEWVPIRPGTDGALFMALIHELIAADAYDHEFLARYTNAAELARHERATATTFGLFVRDPEAPEGNPLFPQNHAVVGSRDRIARCRITPRAPTPRSTADYTLADGTPVTPSFQLLRERVGRLHARVGRRDHRHSRRHDPPARARDGRRRRAISKIELPIPWTDAWGKTHETVTGNPVAFHAMRGLAAHSNGFQTIRALAVLMSLLGTIDRPGGFRHKSPFPRARAALGETAESARRGQAEHAARHAAPLGWPAAPDDLFIDDARRAGAHRQGVLVGVPARRARPDAQRDHQRVARRPVSASTR